MHVIYGRNESGKSSALRALEAWLFGFEERTSDSFIHSYSQLRVGGRLKNANGELTFRRRKARKQSIVDEDEKPLPDDALVPFLHGVTRDQFRVMFGLGHQALVEGGREIVRGGGEVGQALVSAGIGGAQARALLKQLEEDVGALYKSGGSNPPINKLLSAHRDMKKKRDEASLSSREWKAHDDALRQAAADLKRVVTEIADLTNRQSRLQSLRGILPALGRRTKLLEELGALGSAVELRPGFAEERKIAESDLRDAMQQAERARNELERLSGEIRRIAVPEELIAQEDTITDLHERLGSHRKAAADRVGLLKEQALLQTAATDLLSDLPVEMTADEVVPLRLDVAQRMRLRQLAAEHAAITEAISAAVRTVTDSERKLERARDTLPGAETPRNVGRLKRALARVQRRAGIEGELGKAKSALGALEARIAVAIRQLHPALSEGCDPGALPVPLMETADRFIEQLQEIQAELARTDRELKEARDDQAGVTERVKSLRLSISVPNEEDLQAARQRREDGWQLVRREWLNHEDIAAEAAIYDAEKPLPEAYEQRVLGADEVADRLRREADRVAEQAQLVARRATLASRITDQETHQRCARQRRAELFIEWAAEWKPAGVEPLMPNEMRVWLAKFEMVRQQAEQRRKAAEEVARVQDEVACYKDALGRELEELGEECPREGESLSALLERCHELVATEEETERRRATAEQTMASLQDDVRAARQEAENAGRRMADWNQQWSEALRPLGLSGNTLPDVATHVLEQLQEAEQKGAEAKDRTRRIRDIDRDAQAFAVESRALLSRLSPDLGEMPVEQAVAGLHARLIRGKQDETRLASLAEQADAQRKLQEEAEGNITTCEGQLATLCRDAQVRTVEDLPAAESKWGNYQRLQHGIDEQDNAVLQLSPGESIEEIEQEAAAVDLDTIPGHLVEIESRLGQLEAGRSRFDQRIGEERRSLDLMDGGDTAALHAEESQRILAELRDQGQRYVRLRVAAALLRGEIKRYRERNQEPVLQRASELFAKLTVDSFSELASDFNDKDEPVLVGMRPSGEQVRVEGMSDGTCDQLYLALRLASLERYLESNEPMPFIVDDILIRFDDGRAKAALEALAELSKRTQVIFFTHHERLVSLAGQLPDASRTVVIHRLDQ
jgi:uncharacterized protein YhaN